MTVNSSEAAGCLRAQASEMMRRWEARVRAEIPVSREQQPLVLRNNLAELLTEVARALAPTGETPTMIAGLTLSEDHGSHRAQLAEYHLAEVFLEYRLLRQTILEVLDEQKSVDAEQREVINNALERAMQDAVTQFAQVQQEAERAAGDEARRIAAELRTAYEREHRIAQILQRPLVSKVPEDFVAGLSLATLYEPAQQEAEVGGDFFDVVPLSDGRVALVMADACGKGLEAAVHNTHLKDVLRAFLRESIWHPGAILTRLNNVACDAFAAVEADEGGHFVTLALLVLAPSSGEGLYTSAGAEPLLVVRSSGEAEVVEHPGLPLGIDRGVLYVDQPVQLAPGDTALLLTDGITEARHGRELLGYPGMVRLATQAVQAPTLEEAGQELLAAARTFARGGLSDDACLLLARRR